MADDSQPLGLIPDQLLSNIKEGDCVLFVGADLPLGYEGAPLSRPELAAALAARYDLPRGKSWPETAQAYLARFGNDRNGLVRFLGDHLSGPGVKPGPLHRAIAGAGFGAIVTAWYDDLLELALRDAGYRVSRVVRDRQLPYSREGKRQAIVVKLYGCLSDPESLVLGLWDHAELTSRLSRKLEVVSAFCTMRPPLFVGFDLTEYTPIQLYAHASANMVEDMRRVYAVWPGSLDAARAAWQGRNVEFRQADATAFLQALCSQLPVSDAGAGRRIRVQRAPYKFLDYYQAADADIFCGRDTESQNATFLALSPERLLTLFGPSGAGKTSLLLAGVVPRLAMEGYQHVYVRALDDPLPAVRKAVATRAGRAGWEAGADLRAFLSQALALTDKLVIILDQLEELFLRVGPTQWADFFRELAAALDRPEREVRCIFSLREDYLAYLDEAKPYLPHVLGNTFRLVALDRANARVAITEPAARAGVAVEAALVDVLVGDEGRGRRGREEAGRPAGDLVEADGHVPPAALQIVLDRLYRAALPADHPPDEPPPSGTALTLAAYRAVCHRVGEGAEARDLCGAEAILAGYVGEGLARLPTLKREDDQTALEADPTLGREMLKIMVTSQGTKAAMTAPELHDLLDQAGLAQRDRPRDQVRAEDTRLGLERVRLLRSFERDGVAFYELAHDHLAAKIRSWISREEMEAKLARELLRREMDNWRGAQLLIRPEVLRLIYERREELKRLAPDELALLFRSALAAGHEVAYWFERACRGGVAAEEILREGLESETPNTRAGAAAILGQLALVAAVPWLAAALDDDYAHVRGQARAALGAIDSDEARQALRAHPPRDMVLIPAGEFVMGEDKSDQSDERPSHRVYLDAFYVAKYPVTNADYARFVECTGHRPPDDWLQGQVPPGREAHPVVNVSWYDARDYAAWGRMRLLTEAEWEKAASWEPPEATEVGSPASGRRRYPWGQEFDKNKCNTEESRLWATTLVGRYSPGGDSAYGCADMAGNVWEWTSSLYKAYPYRADDGREDAETRRPRVVRGGSWYDADCDARCACRDDCEPDERSDDTGFRLGMSPALGADCWNH